MSDNDIVITSAVRTAVGSFGGSLSSLTAAQLGAHVIKKSIENSEIKPEDVDMVYMGQVLTAGAGQNPARQAAIHAGIPADKTATTINQVCGSGLASVALAYNSIKCGDGNIIIAGGQESMSNSPHFINVRNGIKMGDGKIQDTMIIDGFGIFIINITWELLQKMLHKNIKLQDKTKILLQQPRKEKQLMQLKQKNLKMKLYPSL